MDPADWRACDGRALRQYQSVHSPCLCRNRRGFRFVRGYHPLRPRGGYQLPALSLVSPEWQIFWFAKVATTMQEAAALAAQGSPHGTAVVADEQTAGIGRHGHSWHSEPASGLYVSIILRLPL